MWEGSVYERNGPPFGLLSTLWIITMTMKTSAFLWRIGVGLIFYIGDMLVLAETKERAKEYVEALVQPLQRKK